MLEFFKKLFGSEPTATPAPYKVETPAPKAEPVVTKPVATAKPKKSTAKPARKPRTPKT